MKRYSNLSLIILLLSLLSACDNKIESKNIIDDNIVIAGSDWYGHAPIWVGIEKGIFAKHHFKVKWIFLSSSLDRIKAISTNTIQFASIGQIAMLKAMAENNSDFYWVGNQDNSPGLEGLVAHKKIKSMQQLKGKRIGLPFNSSVEVTLRQLLDKEKLKPGLDVELINLKVGDIPALFRAGYVDAALIWEPAFTSLQQISGTSPLATDKDTEIFKRYGSMAGPDVLVMAKTWHDNNPQRAKRFMKAYFESLQWAESHLEQTAELAQGTYVRQPLERIKRNLEKIKWNNASKQKSIMSDSQIFTQTNYLLNLLQDQIPSDKRPDFKKWVNLDTLPESDKLIKQ